MSVLIIWNRQTLIETAKTAVSVQPLEHEIPTLVATTYNIFLKKGSLSGKAPLPL